MTGTGKFLAGIAGLALLASASTAGAQSGIKVGTLICDVSGGIGLILGSSKSMKCQFRQDNGSVESYTGKIDKFGVDIGVTNAATLAWAVFSSGAMAPGSLDGTYGGATAEVTAGWGLGANVLVGGDSDSIALQPLSGQTQTGLNVAAGVATITLRR